MENDQEVQKAAAQFSSLNVNAVEFIPSFGMPKDCSTTIEDPPPPPKPVIDAPENNGTGKLLSDNFHDFLSHIRKKERKKVATSKVSFHFSCFFLFIHILCCYVCDPFF